VFELGVPVLGICYGMQTMAHQLGGKVEGGHKREFGFAAVRARGHTELLRDIADFTTPEGHGMLNVWMSHGDKVVEMPPGFKLMASTESCPIAGMADEARRFYAIQFHAEVTHTVQGRAILERFVLGICKAGPDWVMRDHIAEAVEAIRKQVGDEEVILGLSGGVDSSVAAALIHRAIGDQLTCVFVDHGLLRLNEGDMVMDMFAGKLHAKVVRVDAADLFLGKLAGVSEPEPSARSSAACSSTSSRPRPPRSRQTHGAPRRLAGAGHDLSGRHRVGRRQEQEGRHHQEPPQRRRPARAAGAEAAGAAARPVQGRSARAGRGPGPAAGDGLPPSRSRDRAWACASWAR
jgi:GMP synthase (glutamine-hydrolysing)